MKPSKDQLNLFYEVPEKVVKDFIDATGDEFLAWSYIKQLEFCARRDENSAKEAYDEVDKIWFLERAAWYRQEIKNICQSQSSSQPSEENHLGAP